MIGLEIRANGQRLAWARDPFDMHAFRIDVPAGADRVKCRWMRAADGGGGFSEARAAPSSWRCCRGTRRCCRRASMRRRLRQSRHLRAPAGWNVRPAWSPGWCGRHGAVRGNSARAAHRFARADRPLHEGRRRARVCAATRPSAPHLRWRPTARPRSRFQTNSPRVVRRMVAEAGALFGSRHVPPLHVVADVVRPRGAFRPRAPRVERRSSRGERTARSGSPMDVAGCSATSTCTAGMRSIAGPQSMVSPDYQKPMDGRCSGYTKG